MKATEQCFPVIPFIMLYKAILTFESADRILRCEGLKVSMPQTFATKFSKVSKAIKMKNVDLKKKTWWHETTSALLKF